MEMSAAAPHAPGVPGGKNVAVEFEEGIAWVRLNRPEKRNAMSVALAEEMNQVLDALEVDRRLAQMLDSRGESYASSWLEGHLSNGFPTSIELEAALARHGRVRRLQNENLRTHELLMRAEMTRRPRKLTDALDRLLRPVLFDRGSGWRRPFVRAIRGFDRGRTYRTIIVVDRP